MTITLDPIEIIVWLIFGAIVGAIAGRIMHRGRGGFGLVGNIIVGVVGAVIGGFLFSLLDVSLLGSLISLNVGSVTITIDDMLSAVVGALLFVLLLGFVRR